MKKTLTICLVLICFFSIVMPTKSYATTLENDIATSKIVKAKQNEEKVLNKYREEYGLDTYGTVAYILNRARLFSYPLCTFGIIVAAILQYVIGIRKLDTRDTGFLLMITLVTILVIFQILPIIFGLVVKSWI